MFECCLEQTTAHVNGYDTSVPGLSVPNYTITSQVDISATLDTHFTSLCSYDSYNTFKLLKKTEELPPNFASRLAELSNAGFHMGILLAALDRCFVMSWGHDSIHNQMFSHLLCIGREFCCPCTTVYVYGQRVRFQLPGE
jgi:hypothetical protein